MEREMASIIYTPKDIFDQDFKVGVRGYSKVEVDEFLDDVIKDYETYAALVKELREENARLKAELAKKSNEAATSPLTQSIMGTPHQAASATLTNFDILKRLNRLEKEVFGKQILNNEI